MQNRKFSFASDYMEGAHQKILERLCETNFLQTAGYGLDEFSESARKKIRKACGLPNAEIHFLSGGTQTNAIVIGSLLKSYQGVIAAKTGHISVHEAGAIEAGGHKVFELEHENGKLKADSVRAFIETFYEDANREHMVMPGAVYISQPTECGALYTRKEMEALKCVCKDYKIPLYADGARLAYALAAPENDVSIRDIAKFCDVFYIGGTKCGALFGECVVIPDSRLIPHFFTIVKQHGALLAKGRILGLQFDTLFTDNLYFEIGKNAIDSANLLKEGFKEKGFEFYSDSPTNQIFIVIENTKLKELSKIAEFGFWEKYDDKNTVVRFATSWATKTDDVKNFLAAI